MVSTRGPKVDRKRASARALVKLRAPVPPTGRQRAAGSFDLVTARQLLHSTCGLAAQDARRATADARRATALREWVHAPRRRGVIRRTLGPKLAPIFSLSARYYVACAHAVGGRRCGRRCAAACSAWCSSGRYLLVSATSLTSALSVHRALRRLLASRHRLAS